jgi:DNA modification methylase
MSSGELRVRNLGIRRVRVRDIVDNPRNYRTHGDEQREGFAKTVAEIGWYGYPDVFEHPDYPGKVMLIDGELRTHHLLAKYGAEAEIEVNVTDFTPAEAAKALATHDPISALAGFDGQKHADLMRELSSVESSAEFQGFLDSLATSQNEQFKSVLENVCVGGNTNPDDVPDEPSVAMTRAGDLWLLGEHRLLCGDAANLSHVERLMTGNKADMLLTDPPYGVSYVGKTKDALIVENDNLSEKDLTALVVRAFDNAAAICRGGAYWYATVPAGPLHILFADDWKRRGVLRQIMVWVKDAMVLGHSEYHYQHEPILFGWIPGERHKNSDRTRTTIWKYDRPKASREHPTMKPVALWAQAVTDGSRTGEVVYDPFLGSGTTIIAAEQLGRKCYGMELSPVYCDVIVNRWEAYTGRSATLVEATSERRGT